MRLAILTSHPIQYYAPLYRQLASRMDLQVIYAHRPTPKQQGEFGFGKAFEWDVDLLSGYDHTFLENVSSEPRTDRFGGCDTPQVGELILGGKFDALLVTGWHLKSYIQGIVAAKRARLPVLVRGDSQLATPRGPLKRLAKVLVYPPLLRLFNAALYVGELNRRYYLHYGYPAQRLFKVPHCVDTTWFAARATPEAGRSLRTRLGIPDNEDVVLFAGKIVDFKRPLDVVDALAKLQTGRPVSLLVAGTGPLEAEMVARAKAQGVKLNCLGFCNQSQMPSVYAAAQVLALPSNGTETWGLVSNEAIACGTPIVVSDAVGCAPDLTGKGAAGRSFPFMNVNALAEAIAATLKSPPSADDVARVSRLHSIDTAVDGIEEAVSSVLRP